jgi:hypothetical protein
MTPALRELLDYGHDQSFSDICVLIDLLEAERERSATLQQHWAMAQSSRWQVRQLSQRALRQFRLGARQLLRSRGAERP